MCFCNRVPTVDELFISNAEVHERPGSKLTHRSKQVNEALHLVEEGETHVLILQVRDPFESLASARRRMYANTGRQHRQTDTEQSEHGHHLLLLLHSSTRGAMRSGWQGLTGCSLNVQGYSNCMTKQSALFSSCSSPLLPFSPLSSHQQLHVRGCTQQQSQAQECSHAADLWCRI